MILYIIYIYIYMYMYIYKYIYSFIRHFYIKSSSILAIAMICFIVTKQEFISMTTLGFYFRSCIEQLV